MFCDGGGFVLKENDVVLIMEFKVMLFMCSCLKILGLMGEKFMKI